MMKNGLKSAGGEVIKKSLSDNILCASSDVHLATTRNNDPFLSYKSKVGLQRVESGSVRGCPIQNGQCKFADNAIFRRSKGVSTLTKPPEGMSTPNTCPSMYSFQYGKCRPERIVFRIISNIASKLETVLCYK